jgi:hypothetical protein
LLIEMLDEEQRRREFFDLRAVEVGQARVGE